MYLHYNYKRIYQIGPSDIFVDLGAFDNRPSIRSSATWASVKSISGSDGLVQLILIGLWFAHKQPSPTYNPTVTRNTYLHKQFALVSNNTCCIC